MKWYEFVSRVTASRITLIRKSLYSSRIFEERWTIKWMRFFRDLGVNLRRSPFSLSGLSLRHAALASFPSPGKSFSFKIVHYSTVHNQTGDELSLTFAWNKLFPALVLRATCESSSSPSSPFAVRFANSSLTAVKISAEAIYSNGGSLSTYRYRTLLLFNAGMPNESFFSLHKRVITHSLPNDAHRKALKDRNQTYATTDNARLRLCTHDVPNKSNISIIFQLRSWSIE
jgi:hypothetical protein